jgi:hypothetical protein
MKNFDFAELIKNIVKLLYILFVTSVFVLLALLFIFARLSRADLLNIDAQIQIIWLILLYIWVRIHFNQVKRLL